ncbi:MAG: hypothetical protein NT105_23655 [Verrucomicrobia bacterium]|nr:hypothetical protein [Verrucomicrobiota bacterium]
MPTVWLGQTPPFVIASWPPLEGVGGEEGVAVGDPPPPPPPVPVGVGVAEGEAVAVDDPPPPPVPVAVGVAEAEAVGEADAVGVAVGAAMMRTPSGCLMVLPSASVARIHHWKRPATVGVPESTPRRLSVKPGGSEP